MLYLNQELLYQVPRLLSSISGNGMTRDIGGILYDTQIDDPLKECT